MFEIMTYKMIYFLVTFFKVHNISNGGAYTIRVFFLYYLLIDCGVKPPYYYFPDPRRRSDSTTTFFFLVLKLLGGKTHFYE